MDLFQLALAPRMDLICMEVNGAEVRSQGTKNLGAFHGAEVPFVFGDTFELVGGEVDLSVRKRILCAVLY